MSKYNDIRSQIQDGDLIFFKNGKGIVSETIRYVTRSKYSHCGILFWMDVHNDAISDPRLCLIEQMAFNRRIVNMSAEVLKDFDIIRTPIKFSSYANKLIEGVGAVPYSIPDLLSIGLLEAFNIKTENHPGQVCSEMVGEIMKEAGLIKASFVSPKKLVQELLNTGKCNIIFDVEV